MRGRKGRSRSAPRRSSRRNLRVQSRGKGRRVFYTGGKFI